MGNRLRGRPGGNFAGAAKLSPASEEGRPLLADAPWATFHPVPNVSDGTDALEMFSLSSHSWDGRDGR